MNLSLHAQKFFVNFSNALANLRKKVTKLLFTHTKNVRKQMFTNSKIAVNSLRSCYSHLHNLLVRHYTQWRFSTSATFIRE